MAALSPLSTTNERLREELEFLQNVYTAEEVGISEHDGNEADTNVIMTVHAATAGETDRQYVCVMLYVTLPPQYPDESPLFEIRNPRGLSENEVMRLKESLQEYIEDERGNPILMQMFEMARETLTDTNIPHGVCSICLSDFKHGDLLKTDCYHYFHVTCMSKYRAHWLQETADQPQETLPSYLESADIQFVCPECRKPIQISDDVLMVGDSNTESFTYVASKEMREQQRKWQILYNKQLKAGGIIDIEKEREKHRLPAPSAKSEVEEADVQKLTDTVQTPNVNTLSLTDTGHTKCSNDSSPRDTEDKISPAKRGGTHGTHHGNTRTGYRHSKGYHAHYHKHGTRPFNNRYNHPRHERPSSAADSNTLEVRSQPHLKEDANEMSPRTSGVSNNDGDAAEHTTSAKSELGATNSQNLVDNTDKTIKNNQHGRYRRPYRPRYSSGGSNRTPNETTQPLSTDKDRYVKKVDNSNESKRASSHQSADVEDGHIEEHKHLRRPYQRPYRSAQTRRWRAKPELNVGSVSSECSHNVVHGEEGHDSGAINGSAQLNGVQESSTTNPHSATRGKSTRGRGSTRGRNHSHWRGPRKHTSHSDQRGDNPGNSHGPKQSIS